MPNKMDRHSMNFGKKRTRVELCMSNISIVPTEQGWGCNGSYPGLPTYNIRRMEVVVF